MNDDSSDANDTEETTVMLQKNGIISIHTKHIVNIIDKYCIVVAIVVANTTRYVEGERMWQRRIDTILYLSYFSFFSLLTYF